MFRHIARRAFQAPAATLRQIQAPSITSRPIQMSFITPRQLRAPVISSHQIRCMASANRSPEDVTLASLERVLQNVRRYHEYVEKVDENVEVILREVKTRQEKARRDAILISVCIVIMTIFSAHNAYTRWTEDESTSREAAKT